MTYRDIVNLWLEFATNRHCDLTLDIVIQRQHNPTVDLMTGHDGILRRIPDTTFCQLLVESCTMKSAACNFNAVREDYN